MKLYIQAGALSNAFTAMIQWGQDNGIKWIDGGVYGMNHEAHEDHEDGNNKSVIASEAEGPEP